MKGSLLGLPHGAGERLVRSLWGAALVGMLAVGAPVKAGVAASLAEGDALPAASRAPLPAPLPSLNAAAARPAATAMAAAMPVGLNGGTVRSSPRISSGVVTPAAPAPQPVALQRVDLRGVAASSQARQMAQIAFEGGDARGLPFAVVDKQEAQLLVFHADGRLAGASAALLGLARGDALAPNVGQMVATGIPPALRTTPAGRYDTQPGRNLKGETVIWVDYDAAFAIHRLRPSPAGERRAERLASATPEDNRISLGCVIVTGEFFDRVVRPALGQGAGVVYVLPDPPALADSRVAMNSAGLARPVPRPL